MPTGMTVARKAKKLRKKDIEKLEATSAVLADVTLAGCDEPITQQGTHDQNNQNNVDLL